MLSFIQFTTEEKNAGVVAGKGQYTAAAKLTSFLTKKPYEEVHGKLHSHFEDSQNTSHTEDGITVHRYTTPDTGKDISDIVLGSEHGPLQGGVEVVSGAGKMFFSKRGHKSGGIDFIKSSPTLRGFELEPEAATKISDPTGFRRVGRSVARDIQTRKHSAIGELEANMKAKHWLIGEHLISAGNLSHFVSSSFMTQGETKTPRLSVRIGGVINPENPGSKPIASEKNWHTQLNTLLHSFKPEQLQKYGVTRIANPS
jgi:hypothetical protein